MFGRHEAAQLLALVMEAEVAEKRILAGHNSPGAGVVEMARIGEHQQEKVELTRQR